MDKKRENIFFGRDWMRVQKEKATPLEKKILKNSSSFCYCTLPSKEEKKKVSYKRKGNDEKEYFMFRTFATLYCIYWKKNVPTYKRRQWEIEKYYSWHIFHEKHFVKERRRKMKNNLPRIKSIFFYKTRLWEKSTPFLIHLHW